MSRESLQPDRGPHYERPHHQWICGDAAEGNPCPLGPSRHGVCARQQDCVPRFQDGRWHCTKPACFGGPCEPGPTPAGGCGLPVRDCQPVSTLRRRRGVLVLAATAAALAVAIWMLLPARRLTMLSPGSLHTSHARLLQGNGTTDQCAQCHPNGNRSPQAWLQQLFGGQAAGGSMSSRCLACHQNHLGPAALAVHSRFESAVPGEPSSPLATLPASHVRQPRVSDNSQQLECATCHQEHQGAEANLSLLSNAQCASCHAHTFQNFAADHPEFTAWPSSLSTIAFSHQAHAAKHFPERQQSFACNDCHASQGDGAVMSTAGFERCSNCHDATIRVGTAAGVTLVSLPMLDTERLAEDGPLPFRWPATAQGDFDGELPPLMQLLLLADAEFALIWSSLGADFDFLELDSEEPEARRHAITVGAAIQRLATDLRMDPMKCVAQRLSSVLGVPVSTQRAERLLQGLPQEFLADTLREWFPTAPPADVPSAPTAPSADQPATEFDAPINFAEPGESATQLASDPVGWEHHRPTNQLRYRPAGHGDPFLYELISLLHESVQQQGDDKSPTWHAVRRLQQHITIQQCTVCHQSPMSETFRWSLPTVSRAAQVTRFAHQPHLVQQGAAHACSSCHRLPDAAPRVTKVSVDEPDIEMPVESPADDATCHRGVSDFAPLRKEMCAGCHQQGLAGDSCLQCHGYHFPHAANAAQ